MSTGPPRVDEPLAVSVIEPLVMLKDVLEFVVMLFAKSALARLCVMVPAELNRMNTSCVGRGIAPVDQLLGVSQSPPAEGLAQLTVDRTVRCSKLSRLGLRVFALMRSARRREFLLAKTRRRSVSNMAGSLSLEDKSMNLAD